MMMIGTEVLATVIDGGQYVTDGGIYEDMGDGPYEAM